MTQRDDTEHMQQLGQEAKDEAVRTVKNARSFLRYLDQQAWFPQHTPYNIFLLMKKKAEVRTLLSEEEIAQRGLFVPADAEWVTFVIETQLPGGADGVNYRPVRFLDEKTLGLPVPPAPDLDRYPQDKAVKLIGGCGIPSLTVEKLPAGEYGAWYDNAGNRLLVPEDMDDAELLFQRLAVQLALAGFSRRVTPFSRKDLAYPALCAAYLLCRRCGVSTEDLSVHRIRPALAGMEEKTLRPTLFLIQKVFQEMDGILAK